jgi:hypothetical protein
MPPIVLGEYRNQHSQRCYPFLDSCTLTDADGWSLPTDFIIDAFMYPIDLANGLYISKIVRGEQKIYFADTVTQKVHGVALIEDADTAYVYEPEGLQRQIGIITFGTSKQAGLQGNSERLFDVGATEFTPTAYIPLNQPGVRGIQLDDGTTLTGHVTFEGRDGVRVRSYYGTQGEHILEFSIIGVPPPLDPDCFGCGFIREICVERKPGSVFMVSDTADSTLAIDTYDLTLDSICQAQKLLRLPNDCGSLPPDGDDPCEDEPPPGGEPDPGPEIDFCYDVYSFIGSSFYIVTPSVPGAWNPLHIKSHHDYAFKGSARLRVPARSVTNVDDVEALVARFRDPPDLGDAMELSFKGLSAFKRGSHA